jgi:hypothetical protein
LVFVLEEFFTFHPVKICHATARPLWGVTLPADSPNQVPPDHRKPAWWQAAKT